VGNSHICAAHFDDALDFLRMRAAAAVVDIHAIGLIMRDRHVCSELAQDAWRRFISGAVCHIDSDAHFFERHPSRKARLGKFYITAECVIDARGTPDFVSGWPDGINLARENELLDFFLHLIVQLVAVVPEKFDAVVFVGIVRGGENDAGIGAKRAGDVSHTGRRQWPDDENIDTERCDSCHQRVLKHVTRKARVLAEHNFWARARWGPARIQFRENERRRAAEFQRSFRRDRLDVRDAANAISTENFLLLGHGLIETLEWQFVNGKLLSIVIPSAVEEPLTFSPYQMQA